ncbi:hypothetical protein KEM55_009331, partial [Ascosphaera atra]
MDHHGAAPVHTNSIPARHTLQARNSQPSSTGTGANAGALAPIRESQSTVPVTSPCVQQASKGAVHVSSVAESVQPVHEATKEQRDIASQERDSHSADSAASKQGANQRQGLQSRVKEMSSRISQYLMAGSSLDKCMSESHLRLPPTPGFLIETMDGSVERDNVGKIAASLTVEENIARKRRAMALKAAKEGEGESVPVPAYDDDTSCDDLTDPEDLPMTAFFIATLFFLRDFFTDRKTFRYTMLVL